MRIRNFSSKQAFLYLSKLLGLFYLSRYLTRQGLRILCYHGFASEDENLFRPKLFINYETFQKRLQFLKGKNYPVLTLDEALDSLERKDLPNCATVITIDDGFSSVYKSAHHLLNKFSFPATLYLTTYYSQKGTPIFRLVIQYMFWKTGKTFLNLSDVDPSLSGQFSLTNPFEKDNATWEIIKFGEEHCNEQQRIILEKHLGEILAVDFDQIHQSRILSLVNDLEIQFLAAHNIDVQLHTHRHHLPTDEDLAVKEILDNRAFLEPLVDKKLQHLCYPSGVWSQDVWPWLAAIGIKSATTCESGFNYPETPRLGLKRFLDGENITQIQFEAELAGYYELFRHARSSLKRLLLWRKR